MKTNILYNPQQIFKLSPYITGKFRKAFPSQRLIEILILFPDNYWRGRGLVVLVSKTPYSLVVGVLQEASEHSIIGAHRCQKHQHNQVVGVLEGGVKALRRETDGSRERERAWTMQMAPMPKLHRCCSLSRCKQVGFFFFGLFFFTFFFGWFFFWVFSFFTFFWVFVGLGLGLGVEFVGGVSFCKSSNQFKVWAT